MADSHESNDTVAKNLEDCLEQAKELQTMAALEDRTRDSPIARWATAVVYHANSVYEILKPRLSQAAEETIQQTLMELKLSFL